MINCELLPDKSKFRDSYAPEADQDDLQIVYDNLKKLVIPIRKGSVRFQAVFTCSRRKWTNIAVHEGSSRHSSSGTDRFDRSLCTLDLFWRLD